MECNGCHNPNSGQSHGRANLFAAVNTGAAGDGVLFPGTNSAFGLVNAGDTMAEVRNRIMCGATGCPPTMDVIGVDLWPTTPPPAFDYCYSTGGTEVGTDPTDPNDPSARHACASTLTTPAPAATECERQWTSRCRATINYEQHMQPLWNTPRVVTDALGTVIADNTCTTGGCHVPVNAMGQTAVPAGQLDLRGQPSNDVPDRFISYQELLFSDNEQEVIMGALQDRPGPVQVPASMSAAGARASARFFSRFDTAVAGQTVDHRTFLTPAEKRLIAEWLDIGAQYYNNPFAAPLN